MSLANALLPEFDHEMATTRKTQERVPEERFDRKPHPKSTAMRTRHTSLDHSELGESCD